MKRILFLLSSILVMFACSKEQTSTEQKEKEKAVAVTGDCSSVTANTATVFGWCNQVEQPGLSAVYGIEYSATDLTKDAKSAEATSKDADNKFSCLLTDLSSDTKYYYRTYVLFNAVRSYGEVKNFTTLKIQASITAESSNVKYSTATISGKLTVASEGTFTKSAALYYSNTATTLDALKSSGTKKTLTLGSDGSYSIDLSSLVSDTKYYYVVVSKVDDIELKTEVKNFTTLKIQASITAESSNVKYSTATISGKLTVASEGTFTKSAYLYHSSTASTLDALKSSGTKQTITLNSDGTYSVVAGGLKADAKNYYCVVAKVDDAEFTTSVKNFTTLAFPQPQSVNLGLSVKWASFNIGASKPEEYGHYFAWGDVTGQTWDGSKWSGSGFSTYPTYEVDSNDNLKPEYDAAHVILGGKWRMPTKAEFEELVNNCTCTWTTINGVNGRLFTSKKTGYTDKSIFLPAAGYGFYSSLYYAGSFGYYWSSTFSNDYYAWGLSFHSGDVGADGSGRYGGQSIRPVTE